MKVIVAMLFAVALFNSTVYATDEQQVVADGHVKFTYSSANKMLGDRIDFKRDMLGKNVFVCVKTYGAMEGTSNCHPNIGKLIAGYFTNTGAKFITSADAADRILYVGLCYDDAYSCATSEKLTSDMEDSLSKDNTIALKEMQITDVDKGQSNFIMAVAMAVVAKNVGGGTSIDKVARVDTAMQGSNASVTKSYSPAPGGEETRADMTIFLSIVDPKKPFKPVISLFWDEKKVHEIRYNEKHYFIYKGVESIVDVFPKVFDQGMRDTVEEMVGH